MRRPTSLAVSLAVLGSAFAGPARADGPVWVNALAPGPSSVTSIAARPGLVLAGGAVHEIGASIPVPGPRQPGLFRSTDEGRSWSLGQERVVENGEVTFRPITTTPSLVAAPPAGPDAYAVFGLGVWRSDDDGATWSPVGTLSSAPAAMDFLADGRPVVGLAGGGLRVSADRGATWAAVGSGLPASRVNEILPYSGTVVMAATDAGLYRSTDGGSTFAQVTSGIASPTQVAYGVAAEGTSALYLAIAGGSVPGTAIYVSSDQGATWSPRLQPQGQLSLPAVNRGALELVVQGSLFVLYAGTPAGLLRTGRQGAIGTVWERVDPDPGRRGATELAYYDADPGPLRNHAIIAAVRRASPAVVTATSTRLAAPGWIDEVEGGRVCGGIVPRRDGVVFAACGRHVVRSDDRGATWTDAGAGLPYNGPGLTDSYFGLGSSADGSLWISGFHDGLWHSNAAVTSWSRAPFPAASVGAVAGHPTDANVVYASGLTTNGCCTSLLYRSTDGGLTWGRPLHEVGANIYTISVSPQAPHRVMIGAFTGGIHVSEDGGTTWVRSTGWTDAIYEARYSGASPDRAYARGREGLLRSDDGGKTWEPLGRVVVDGRTLSDWELAPSPWDADTLYIVAGGDVVVSRDAGETFHILGSGLIGDVCPGCNQLEELAVDPSVRGGLYVMAGTFEGISPYSMWPHRGLDPAVPPA